MFAFLNLLTLFPLMFKMQLLTEIVPNMKSYLLISFRLSGI